MKHHNKRFSHKNKRSLIAPQELFSISARTKPSNAPRPLEQLAQFSSQGKYLFTHSQDYIGIGDIGVWDIKTRNKIISLQNPYEQYLPASSSNDDRLLNVSTQHKDPSMKRVHSATISILLAINISTISAMKNPASLVMEFHKAIMTHENNIVSNLIQDGMQIEARILDDQTPIHTAALAGNLETLKLLAECKANMYHRMHNGSTLLHSAAEGGNIQLTRWVIKSLKEKNPEVVNATTEVLETPLHRAAFHGHCAIIELLINNGAQIEARNHNRATPLHVAATNGHSQAIEILFTLGAKINALDINNSTPLHNAYASCAYGTIMTLEKLGANRSIRNNLGLTPPECGCKIVINKWPLD